MFSVLSKLSFKSVAQSLTSHRLIALGLPIAAGLAYLGPIPMFVAGGLVLGACGLQLMFEKRPIGTMGGPASYPYVACLILGLGFLGYSADKMRAIEIDNARACVAAQREVALALAFSPSKQPMQGTYQTRQMLRWDEKPQTNRFSAKLVVSTDDIVRIIVSQDGQPDTPRTFARPNGAEQLRS